MATLENVIIALSHHSPKMLEAATAATSLGEKLVGPEAAVEAEVKLVKVTLQMLIAQAMVGSHEEGLQIEDQGVYPAQSATVLIKDLIMVDIPLTQRGAERPKGIAVDIAARTNDALDHDTY